MFHPFFISSLISNIHIVEAKPVLILVAQPKMRCAFKSECDKWCTTLWELIRFAARLKVFWIHFDISFAPNQHYCHCKSKYFKLTFGKWEKYEKVLPIERDMAISQNTYPDMYSSQQCILFVIISLNHLYHSDQSMICCAFKTELSTFWDQQTLFKSCQIKFVLNMF